MIPRFLRSTRCPSCGTDNVRKSGVKDRKKNRPILDVLLKSWFRCRECGHRFFARDAFLLRFWLLSGLALVAILMTLIVGYSYRSMFISPAVFQGQTNRSLPTSTEQFDADLSPSSSIIEDEMAAKSGDPEAQYLHGLRVIKRAWQQGEQFKLVDGVKWIRLAAESGHLQAQSLLGRCYETGRGVIQDYTQAFIWYQRSAIAGSPVAMVRLARMYSEGRGAPEDIVQAYQWLNLAAARGLSEAERVRGRIQLRMSDEQLLSAQKESRYLDQTVPSITPDLDDWPSGF
jgi:hypothetical protein